MAKIDGALLERAQQLHRSLVEERREAQRSANVPFVPKPDPRGWHDLTEEIRAEFDLLSKREHEVEEAYERIGSERRAGRQTDRVLNHASRQRHAQYNKEWRALMRDAGRCLWCGRPRGADGTLSFCREHADRYNARTQIWRARCRSEGRSTWPNGSAMLKKARQDRKRSGLCIKGCGRPIRPPRLHGRGSGGGRRPSMCAACAEELRSRAARRRADERERAINAMKKTIEAALVGRSSVRIVDVLFVITGQRQHDKSSSLFKGVGRALRALGWGVRRTWHGTEFCAP